MTLPNPILGPWHFCVNFHCEPTQKRGFFMLTENFKWHFYKNDPILGSDTSFGSIFTVNTLKNHFFWPFFTVNTLKNYFWGYFYVKNTLFVKKCVILRKKCIFYPQNCWKSQLLLKKWPPSHFGSKWPKNDPPTPILGGHMTPPSGGVFGGQKWVKNDHFWVIFHDFFQKKPLDFPITFFSKKNPWISLLLFFKKMAIFWPFLVILSLGNPPFSDFLKKNHWIW